MNTNIEQYDFSGKKILIAEDELVNYKLLEIILKKVGAHVVHAKSGFEAITIYSSGEVFDLILMDIKMPEKDGIEVISEIRKEDKLIPIIAQTAYAVDEERIKAFEAGCNEYIVKPIRKNELLHLIQLLLN